uniref:Centrosomal protein 43 n=1 Tax=Cyclopterus lumpus TaxID=8103 RepID=A0A8C2X4H2_CYCLU
MSATEDDTELRDLLVQNLETSGVLNKLKVPTLRARDDNKNPLINENLKKCLNSRDGRLVAGLIVDFLQVFNLDFSLAVFQPEINSLDSLDSRDLVCRDLGLSESQVNRNCPLLLELTGRLVPGRLVMGRLVPGRLIPGRLVPGRLVPGRLDRSGSVGREDLKSVFTDLIPNFFCRNMLESFITDELRSADQSFSSTIDFQVFVGFYKRLFSQCRAVVSSHNTVLMPLVDTRRTTCIISIIQSPLLVSCLCPQDRTQSVGEHLDLDLEVEEDPEDGDSFFDDPLPKPQKTYDEVICKELHHQMFSSFCPFTNKHFKLCFSDDDVQYDDDFNSHRSDFSRSELSIGEEIEEVSIEGPDSSDKFDDSTQDLSISQLSQSHGADYMEEVA